MSYTAVLTATALVFLGVLALIEIANYRITTHAWSAIVPNAVGSLFYAVVVWVWPTLYMLPDYFRRQHGNPIYRVPLSRELLVGFAEAWQPAIGMVATCVAAIVLGNFSLTQIRGSAGRLKGAAIAQAGRGLGYLQLVPLLIYWAFMTVLMIGLSGLAH